MAAPKNSVLELEKIVSGVGSIIRWRILVELGKGEPLPAKEVGRRVRISAKAASKHLLMMRDAGLLHRGYGNLYQIPKAFLVPGEPALDFGAFVLRLNYPDAARK